MFALNLTQNILRAPSSSQFGLFANFLQPRIEFTLKITRKLRFWTVLSPFLLKYPSN